MSSRGKSASRLAAGMDPPGGPTGGRGQRARARSKRGQARDINRAVGTVQGVASAGVAGAGGPLPHLGTIQRAFGRHDVGGVKAHVGGPAADANAALGAKAYATGDAVAFRSQPDLHTSAHEAAHVVQQRGGVQLKGGVGRSGDRYEQHADAVADRVVAGQSAEALLDVHAGGASGGGVQRKKDCGGADCGDCPICEARAQGHDVQLEADGPVQFGLLEAAGEAWDSAVETVSDVVEGVVNWIDLLGPKRDLLGHIVDPGWIVSAVDAAASGVDAHPKHATTLQLKLYAIGVAVGLEAMDFALGISGCESREEVDALRQSFDAWKTAREESLKAELEAEIEMHREIERGWLTAFGASETTADPVNPNKSSQNVALTMKGGLPVSDVIVETRVNCTFKRTSQALQDNDGDGNADVADWTDEEKTRFMEQFQQQLDDVWSTGASASAPFRCAAPNDHLLATESPRWSELTANMQGRVTSDAANPHFQLEIFKEGAGESNRAHVGNGTGVFYIDDADAGYDTAGPNAGLPNGGQHTLAHEWHHMIGNPDEYAENSAAQDASSDTPADLNNRWGTCQQHFQDIIDDSESTPEQKQQARDDLRALQRHATDTSADPGFQSGIFPIAGRDDIPDECFAIRGFWRPTDGHQQLLRPGAGSQRGGTNISASAADAARLSDRGNEVRPYMREGIVEELGKMLEGKFDPEVRFDHNFEDMTAEQITETIRARIQNVLHDQVELGRTQAPSGDGQAPATHDHGDHDGHAH